MMEKEIELIVDSCYKGKRVGFGTEFNFDNHKVDQCGNFINDKRHGWGTTYDRNNTKLYEGDWRCGKNDIEERIVIEDEEDCLKIHELIKELKSGLTEIHLFRKNQKIF